MPELKKGYSFAGRHSFGLFRYVEFYYSPNRVNCWAVQAKGNVKYFSDLRSCVDYARMSGWIKDKDLPTVLKNLAEQERVTDDLWFDGRRAETPERTVFISRETR